MTNDNEVLLPAVIEGGDKGGLRTRCPVNRSVEGDLIEENLQDSPVLAD